MESRQFSPFPALPVSSISPCEPDDSSLHVNLKFVTLDAIAHTQDYLSILELESNTTFKFQQNWAIVISMDSTLCLSACYKCQSLHEMWRTIDLSDYCACWLPIGSCSKYSITIMSDAMLKIEPCSSRHTRSWTFEVQAHVANPVQNNGRHKLFFILAIIVINLWTNFIYIGLTCSERHPLSEGSLCGWSMLATGTCLLHSCAAFLMGDTSMTTVCTCFLLVCYNVFTVSLSQMPFLWSLLCQPAWLFCNCQECDKLCLLF